MEQGDDVNFGRRESDTEIRLMRNWQSVRTVLEGLILVGIVWLGSTVQDQAKATIALQTQMTAISSQLNGVPSLMREEAQAEVKLDDHERRISTLETTSRGSRQ